MLFLLYSFFLTKLGQWMPILLDRVALVYMKVLGKRITTWNVLSRTKQIRSQLEMLKKWDWQVIFICFSLAFLFWVFNNLNVNHTTNISFPIEFETKQKDLVAITPPVEEINVNISGYGWNLLKETIGLNQKNIKVALEQAISKRFITAKTLRPFVEQHLKEMKINYILEDTIFFNYDTLATKPIFLAINPNKIFLDAGYRFISDITITPDTLQMTGAASILKTYSDTIFIDIDETGIDGNFNETVSVNYPRNKFISIDNRLVKVKFDIALYINKRLPVRVYKENFPEDKKYTITPQEAYLEYFIQENSTIQLKDSISAFVDFEEMNPVDSTIVPRFYLPSQIVDISFVERYFTISELEEAPKLP